MIIIIIIIIIIIEGTHGEVEAQGVDGVPQVLRRRVTVTPPPRRGRGQSTAEARRGEAASGVSAETPPPGSFRRNKSHLEGAVAQAPPVQSIASVNWSLIIIIIIM